MKKHSKRRLFFNFIITFVGFFILSGITTTVSMLMFLHSLEISFDYIIEFAPITFINLLFVSLLFGIIGTAWKSITIERPVTAINEALLKIRKGELSTKIKRRLYPSRFSTIVNNINLMTTELSSIDNLKVSLMSNISHELKTPISVISNYAALLQDESIDESKKVEYAKAISDSSKKMSELITNILKLNQLENQKIPSEIKEYNVSEQLCECLLNFEAQWEKKGIEIETDIADEVYVAADKELLSLVWNNLLSNALKFTEKDGVVTLNLYVDEEYAYVQVKDTGCGMTPETGANIFKKFYQGDTSHATKGNGLGLALVKRVIDICKGEIAVSSCLGEGSTFTVRLSRSKEIEENGAK